MSKNQPTKADILRQFREQTAQDIAASRKALGVKRTKKKPPKKK